MSPPTESKTTPIPNRLWKLRMLRTEIAAHNPDGDNVKTLDWAIGIVEIAKKIGNEVALLRELANDR
jgi:hypothetical protein